MQSTAVVAPLAPCVQWQSRLTPVEWTVTASEFGHPSKPTLTDSSQTCGSSLYRGIDQGTRCPRHGTVLQDEFAAGHVPDVSQTNDVLQAAEQINQASVNAMPIAPAPTTDGSRQEYEIDGSWQEYKGFGSERRPATVQGRSPSRHSCHREWRSRQLA